MKSSIPSLRIRATNQDEPRPQGEFVLYWMVASRRTTWNYGLDRAVEWARALGRPLVVLEALRCDHPWASDRSHAYVLQGMRGNRQRLAGSDLLYHPYVEPGPGQGRGLLEALAARACVVVTDDAPGFFLPRMLATAAARIQVRLEAVDSNGILPMHEPDRVFPTAHSLRRHLQTVLPDHLGQRPKTRLPPRGSLPVLRHLPKDLTRRWPAASDEILSATPAVLARLPIDHDVTALSLKGGQGPARKRWRDFLWERLDSYEQSRNRPEENGASGLSGDLHFGTLSAHQVVAELLDLHDWTPARLAHTRDGRREGWWGLPRSAEAFLDQVITWRELGFNFCSKREDHDRFSSLPEWARNTLQQHERDPRDYRYTQPQFEEARTHDPLWNAAQRQLRQEGRIHNYLRMLWGKKILEWSDSPKQALAVMIHLNNKYALDGRDPNSYSGIFWVLGRYDRPWGPERPIFGKVRFMTSANTARKFPVAGYLRRFGPEDSGVAASP